MKYFEYEGKRINIEITTGTVMGAHKHAETHISGSASASAGASGYGAPGYGHGGSSASVSISSEVITKQDFFLKCGVDKPEVPVQLTDLDIPLRDGQKVSMLSAGPPDKGGYYVRLINHTTKLSYAICSGLWFVEKWKLAHTKAVRRLIGWAIIVGAFFLSRYLVASSSIWPNMNKWLLATTKLKEKKLAPALLFGIVLSIALTVAITYWIYQARVRRRAAKRVDTIFNELARKLVVGAKG